MDVVIEAVEVVEEAEVQVEAEAEVLQEAEVDEVVIGVEEEVLLPGLRL